MKPEFQKNNGTDRMSEEQVMQAIKTLRKSMNRCTKLKDILATENR
jgi:hypothetical protein